MTEQDSIDGDRPPVKVLPRAPSLKEKQERTANLSDRELQEEILRSLYTIEKRSESQILWMQIGFVTLACLLLFIR